MSDEALADVVRSIRATETDKNDALDEILRRNYNWIMRVCLAEFTDKGLAHDCGQEALLRVSQGISRFQGKSKLSTWIFVILRRTISDFRGRIKRDRLAFGKETDYGSAEQHIDDSDREKRATPEGQMLQSERLGELMKLVRTLPEKQRHAVILHYFEDLSVEDAAARLGCSESALKTHLFRARRTLKGLLQPAGSKE